MRRSPLLDLGRGARQDSAVGTAGSFLSRLRAIAARHPRKLKALAAVVVLPVAAHFAVLAGTRITPPAVNAPKDEPVLAAPDLRVLGPAYARHRGKILEVRLAGSPEAIGHQHGRLLYGEMAL